MTIFELLGIDVGDAIIVDNPWSSNGPRDVIPLSLSRSGISVRAIDTRYGDICYVQSDWSVSMSDGRSILLRDIPFIKQNLTAWNEAKEVQKNALDSAKNERREAELHREFASIDEVLNTLQVANLKVAITGTLPIPRAKFKSMLEGKGAMVVGTVGKQTAYLFMGDTGKHEITSKMQRAHELGVKIITL